MTPSEIAKELIKKIGTQQQAADKIGIPQETLCRIAHGKTPSPRWPTMEKLLRAKNEILEPD
ncbi:helix-turn-helix domain-containing protein [Agitococcus lubricus]|uniref:helix-turn-helix domain-containing protein n=1 Tax=Agitococcus lubricus TaxID=1077255 RepID=UPI000D311C0E|nr:helix-turn-helix transcriptional regulator [Agitococcus lubricus]